MLRISKFGKEREYEFFRVVSDINDKDHTSHTRSKQ